MSLTFSLINDRNWTVTAAVQLQTHVCVDTQQKAKLIQLSVTNNLKNY